MNTQRQSRRKSINNLLRHPHERYGAATGEVQGTEGAGGTLSDSIRYNFYLEKFLNGDAMSFEEKQEFERLIKKYFK